MAGQVARIERIVRDVRGPLRSAYMNRMGAVGLEILREEMPEGKTGDLRAKAQYAVFERSQTRAAVSWWSDALTSDGKRKDMIVDQGPGQPKHTKGSPGRYVPAIGKRLKKGRTAGLGMGRDAAKEWARQHGLKMPFKTAQIKKVPKNVDEHLLRFHGFSIPYTASKLEAKMWKGMFLDESLTRGDIYLTEHAEEELEVTSFHEQLHTILSYNAKYGNKEQKATVSRLITGGVRTEDYEYLTDGPGGRDDWAELEEEFVLGQEPMVARLKWQRAITELKKKGWKIYEGESHWINPDDTHPGQLIIEKEGVGYAHITLWNQGPQAGSAHMEYLEARTPGRGYGRETWNVVKRALRLAGISRITAHSMEEVEGFWRKMGFKDERWQGKDYAEQGGANLMYGFGIGWHPGSKRTPFYRRSLARIRAQALGIFNNVVGANIE